MFILMLDPEEFSGSKVTGLGFDKDTLEQAKIDEAYAFAAVSSGDNSNILATRVARETYHVPHVVARIYDPGRAEIYQRLGIPTVAAVRWSTDQVLRRILPDYSMRGDFREPSGRLVLTEVALHREWYGRLVKDLEAAAGVRVAYLTRFGEGTIPESRTRLQGGDLIHVMMHLDRSQEVEKILASAPKPAPAD